MKKIRLPFLCIILFLFVHCSMAQNTAFYLTGGGTKNWNIVNNSPKDSSSSCNFPNSNSVDNVWTFRSDSSFSFNPGSITISSDSAKCKDMLLVSGRWKLTGNASKLKIFINTSQGVAFSPEESLPDFILESVSESEIRFRVTNEENVTVSYWLNKLTN